MQRRTQEERAPPRGHVARVALSVAWLAACASPVGADPTTPSTPAPDFALKTTDGRNLRLSEYRGDAVLLTFWGSWCGVCRESLGALDAAMQRTGTPVLGVSLDRSTERAASVAAALALQFPTLVDTQQSVARAYDVSRLPLTLLIDRDGAVRATWDGVAVDPDDLDRRLASLRQETPP